MLKRIFFSLFLGMVLTLPSLDAMAKTKQIYMVVWRGCEDACRGFKEYFSERGLDVEITVRDANRDKDVLADFVTEAMEIKPDLVVTWGTSTSRGMIGPYDTETPEKFLSGIPSLFMIVADPVGAKLIREYSSSGREFVTGTHNRVPEDVQIRAIQTYLKADRIGLAYNNDELNSVLNAQKLQKLADELGFELVAKAVSVDENGQPDKQSLVTMVDEFKKEKVDIIYVGSSSFITSNRDIFTQAALNARIPVAAGSEIFVRNSHALLAVANRYYNIGQLAGLQAEQVIFKGKKPIDVEVRSLSRYSFIINMDTARKLEKFPPIQLLRFADLVNK